MKPFVALSFLFTSIMIPNTTHAALLNCGVYDIASVWIQGERDDNNAHANKLIVSLDGADCNGSNLVYIDNSDPNHAAFLSGVMTAYATGMRIKVYVNTSNMISGATQLALFNIVKQI